MRLKQVFRIAAGDLASKALLVGINLYLIHHLAVDQYFHFTILVNAVFLGFQLACGPIERLYIAQHDRYAARASGMRWAFSGAASIALVLWLRNETTWADSVLIVIGVLLLSSYQLLRIRLQQRLEFTLFSLAEILKNALWAALLVLLMAATTLPQGLAAMVALLAATFAAQALLQTFASHRIGRDAPAVAPVSMGALLWETRHVIAYSLVGAIVPYLPVLMATREGDAGVTATYGAATRYLGILGMALFAVNTALLPQMASVARDGHERALLMQRLRRSAPATFTLLAAAILAIWSLIPFVDQGKYPLLPSIFLMLSATPLISLATTPFVNLLLMDGRAHVVFACMAVGLAINIGAYWLLHPYHTAFAPAIASLLGYLSIAIGSILCASARPTQAT